MKYVTRRWGLGFFRRLRAGPFVWDEKRKNAMCDKIVSDTPRTDAVVAHTRASPLGATAAPAAPKAKTDIGTGDD